MGPSFCLTGNGNHPHDRAVMGGVPPWKRPPVPPHPDQGRIIKEARTNEGWGQRKLADALGIDQSYVCLLETGKRSLSPRTARKLYDVLGVRVPLALIDLAETAAGRREAHEQERERLRAAAVRRRLREEELERPRVSWSPLVRRWTSRPDRSRYVMDARELPPWRW